MNTHTIINKKEKSANRNEPIVYRFLIGVTLPEKLQLEKDYKKSGFHTRNSYICFKLFRGAK